MLQVCVSVVQAAKVPPKCSNCAFYTTREKGCARVIINVSDTEAYFERAQVVRSHKAMDVCGPQGKGFVKKLGIALLLHSGEIVKKQ